MKTILISGYMGSGKSSVATLLQEYFSFTHTFDSRIVSLATPVKTIAKEQFGWDGVKDEKGRQLLQNIGHMGRAYDEDIWVRKAYQNIISSPCDFILIDDWRYPNELNYLHKQGLEVASVRVFREVEKSSYGLSHESENSLPTSTTDYDFILENFQDLLKLRTQANSLGEVMLSKVLV